MKKILLSAAVLAVAFVSCKDDDPVTTPAPVVVTPVDTTTTTPTDTTTTTPVDTTTTTPTGNFTPAGTGELLITEFASEGSAEWVEIYNAGSTTLNLNLYNVTQLSSTGSLSTKYWLDSVSGTRTIAPGAYMVIVDDGDTDSSFVARWSSFNHSNAIVVRSFGLSNGTTGDEIIISKKDAAGKYVVVDQVDWTSPTDLKTFGGSTPSSTSDETVQRTDLTGSGDDATKWKVAPGTPAAAN